jgi:flagellar motility protein MotE (MotC chaperone)
MTQRAPSALGILVAMLFLSAALRLAIGAGPALAEAEDILPETPEALPEGRADCDGAVSGELLAALEAREERLTTRESQLADRMQALRVAEQEVREHLEQLRAAEESLEATIATAETANDGDITSLVSVYEGMKPAEAAALFEEMAPEFAPRPPSWPGWNLSRPIPSASSSPAETRGFPRNRAGPPARQRRINDPRGTTWSV